jgi:hypothetical protein
VDSLALLLPAAYARITHVRQRGVLICAIPVIMRMFMKALTVKKPDLYKKKANLFAF